jgi:hypothetical protein
MCEATARASGGVEEWLPQSPPLACHNHHCFFCFVCVHDKTIDICLLFHLKNLVDERWIDESIYATCSRHVLSNLQCVMHAWMHCCLPMLAMRSDPSNRARKLMACNLSRL